MAETYYFSAQEALEAFRKAPDMLRDPYRTFEVLAALERGCSSRSYDAGVEAGKRLERGDDDL